MDIYSILMLIGGLAFFLYGISVMSAGLENVTGGKLEKLLKKMTSNPVKSFALGAGITAVIQSSSAVTVMLIGLVNSGIMDLSQTVSIVFGSNVGTTITAWMLSLTGIQENAAFIIKLLKPESFSPVLAFIGICMIMSSKNNGRKSLGSVMVGFAILMFGMINMANAMAPLAQTEGFRSTLVAFSNPFLGLVAGIVITAILQSSSVSIGILQALTLVGGISRSTAIPIIFGQNIGAAIAPLLASIGVSTNAKRVSGVYALFNFIGTAICFPLYLIMLYGFKPAFLTTDISPVGVAICHTIYNLLVSFALLPFAKQIERLAVKLIPENPKESANKVILDERLLNTPAVAITECFDKTIDMAEIAQSNFEYSTKMLKSYHQKKAEQIVDNETIIDTYEDKLGSFLLKLSGKGLSDENSSRISQLLLTIGEYERIGDHSTNILKVAEKFAQGEKTLSDDAIEELKIIVNAITELFEMSLEAYKTDNVDLATKAEPLEAVIKKGIRRAKNNHIQRLKEGKCNTDSGFMFSDLLTDLRRIAAHCSNIATSVIQLHDSAFDKHEYSHRNKDEDLEFTERYKDYKSRYRVTKLTQ